MENKVWFTNSKGDKLCGILSNPTGDKTKPIVIVCHGYDSNKDRSTYIKLNNALNKKKISVFRFDFYGHGESEGKEVNALQCVYDVINAVKYVLTLEKVNKKEITVIGSSLGGMAALIATVWCKDISSVVLICPAWDIVRLKSVGIHNERLLERIKNIYTVAERIDVPVLIIQGDEDDVVPLSHSSNLVKHLNTVSLVFNGIQFKAVVSYSRAHSSARLEHCSYKKLFRQK